MDEQYDYNDHHNQGNKRSFTEHLVELEIAKKRCKQDKTPELPSEVIIWEILIRLPITSLLRFKSVCKEWRSLIQDDDIFIKKHMSLATPLFVQDCTYICHSKFTTTAILFPKGYQNFSILGVFEGLVVEGKLWDNYYIVRNPATSQMVYLPKPASPYHHVWFNFDPCTGEAKLLCEYSIMTGKDLIRHTGYEILKIGKDEKWTTLKPPTRGQFLMISRDQENMHSICPVWNEVEVLVDIQVSSFGIRSECFSDTIDFPRDVFSDLCQTFSFWWNNNLAFGSLIENDLHVLVLEKQEGNNEYKWSENIIVIPLRFLREIPDRIKETLVFVEVVSDNLWFQIHAQGRYKFCYDMKTGKIKKGLLKEKDFRMFEYRPSLKSLQGMKPVDVKCCICQV